MRFASIVQKALDLSLNCLLICFVYFISSSFFLVELELIQNKLTGQLTSNIGHLSHLSKLDVSHNMLSGDVPNEILRMESLNQLYLNNNMLSGELPDDIKYFGDKTKRSLKMLRFDSNEFSGTIPSEVGQIQLLRKFVEV